MSENKPRFLIVKTSSLGDIIQAFSTLNYLHKRFPSAMIDWVVEKRFATIVDAHPLVRRSIAFDIKRFKTRWRELRFWRILAQSFKALRSEQYDAVFDLQGNCKSGVITFLSQSKAKVGFGRKSVREWPNVLATRVRFEIPRTINIRMQYLRLIQLFFHLEHPGLKGEVSSLEDESAVDVQGVRFKIDSMSQALIQSLLEAPELRRGKRIMICPGSKWINKQLPQDTLASLMNKIEEALHCSFLLVWGAEEEREICGSLQRQFSSCSCVIDRMELPLWQNLMNEMDLVIAVDSSALHLCGTTSTPSFSVFGPTSPEIFKPVGATHFAYQGSCPYQMIFEKQCPLLRSCSSGACIRNLNADELFGHFWKWWQNLNFSSCNKSPV